MEQKHSVDSVNFNVSRIRSDSIENHVNRIRRAYSRRLSNSLSLLENVNLQQDFNSRQKSHEKSVAVEFVEKVNSKIQKQNLEDTSNSSQNESMEAVFEEGSKHVTRKKEMFTSENAHSLKDAVALKMIHGLRCPILRKEKEGSGTSEAERSFVQVYKKPAKISRKLPINIKSTGVKIVTISPNTGERRRETIDIDEQSVDSQSKILQEKERTSTKKNIENLYDVEMKISELGKMQITINPMSFSPEDSCIILWIDEIPKTYFTPKYSTRLSIAPHSETELTRLLAVVTENQPESKLEDLLSSEVDGTFYPPSTVLKNIALYSEVSLKRLNEKDENFLYFTECSCDHVQIKYTKNKYLPSSSKMTN